MQRPTRQLGRSGTMTRGEKRALESAGDDEEMHAEAKRPKVPALARYFTSCSLPVLARFFTCFSLIFSVFFFLSSY
jgi:hypothetical protein